MPTSAVPFYARSFGTVGAFTVAGTTRDATGSDLEANCGAVYVLTVTSGGTTKEIATQPALGDGARAINLAGLAAVASLKLALGV